MSCIAERVPRSKTPRIGIIGKAYVDAGVLIWYSAEWRRRTRWLFTTRGRVDNVVGHADWLQHAALDTVRD